MTYIKDYIGCMYKLFAYAIFVPLFLYIYIYIYVLVYFWKTYNIKFIRIIICINNNALVNRMKTLQPNLVHTICNNNSRDKNKIVIIVF